MIAREVARLIPDSVSQVITYGTPVVGGPTYTPAAGSYGDEECRRIAGKVVELDRESPIRVPVSAIFSRRDGVVSWPACIDRTCPWVSTPRCGRWWRTVWPAATWRAELPQRRVAYRPGDDVDYFIEISAPAAVISPTMGVVPHKRVAP